MATAGTNGGTVGVAYTALSKARTGDRPKFRRKGI